MEQIFLSRRNLVTLLEKLDAVKLGKRSTCTIIKADNQHPKYPQTMHMCAVTALEDGVYYSERKPGPMLPVAELPNA